MKIYNGQKKEETALSCKMDLIERPVRLLYGTEKSAIFGIPSCSNNGRVKAPKVLPQYASFCGTKCPLPVIKGAGILFPAAFDPCRYTILEAIMGVTMIRSGVGRAGIFSGTGLKELPH